MHPIESCRIDISTGSDQVSLNRNSSNPEVQVADGFATEALFELAQNFILGDAFEFEAQRRLEDADVEDAFAQSDGRGMHGHGIHKAAVSASGPFEKIVLKATRK
jgi:hypothetical protein